MISQTVELSIILGVILTIVHYYADRLNYICRRYKSALLSFTAGISLTYICLRLLPESLRAVSSAPRLIFLSLLFGLVVNHIIEKYVYQHSSKRTIMKKLKEVHSILFFIYHFVVGVIMVYIIRGTGFIGGILYFIPMFFHTGISKVSIEEIHDLAKNHPIIRVFLSISTLLGVIVAILFEFSALVTYCLLGFVIGALLYVVIRDEIPEKKKGKLSFFVLGVVLYASMILLAWNGIN